MTGDKFVSRREYRFFSTAARDGRGEGQDRENDDDGLTRGFTRDVSYRDGSFSGVLAAWASLYRGTNCKLYPGLSTYVEFSASSIRDSVCSSFKSVRPGEMSSCLFSFSRYCATMSFSSTLMTRCRDLFYFRHEIMIFRCVSVKVTIYIISSNGPRARSKLSLYMFH